MRTSRAVVLLAPAALTALLAASCSMPSAPAEPSPTTAGPLDVEQGTDPEPHADRTARGRARDAAGALAAGSDAVSMTGEIATAGFITRHDLIASIASTSYADELAAVSARQLDELTVELGQGGTTPRQIVWSELPLRGHVAFHEGRNAVVEIWSVLVVGVRGHGAPRQAWRTVTVGLVWERGGWRVDAWDALAGPTPALASSSVVSTVGEVATALAWSTLGRS